MADLEQRRDDGVLVLTLNRPERRNALSDAMLRELIAALEEAAGDPEVGAVVLAGAGGAFCAGGDVKAMASGPAPGFEERMEAFRWKHRAPMLLRQIPKVVVAAVEGAAFGAGLGLALACDLRVASASARFGTAFARVGYSGDFGVSQFLLQLVGPARARELLILAEPVGAEEALRIGMATRVVPDGTALEEAVALARRLAAGPRVAYGYMKRNLLAAETLDLQGMLDMEAIHQVRAGMTEDFREAALAFTEKRTPVFRGR